MKIYIRKKLKEYKDSKQKIDENQLMKEFEKEFNKKSTRLYEQIKTQ